MNSRFGGPGVGRATAFISTDITDPSAFRYKSSFHRRAIEARSRRRVGNGHALAAGADLPSRGVISQRDDEHFGATGLVRNKEELPTIGRQLRLCLVSLARPSAVHGVWAGRSRSEPKIHALSLVAHADEHLHTSLAGDGDAAAPAALKPDKAFTAGDVLLVDVLDSLRRTCSDWQLTKDPFLFFGPSELPIDRGSVTGRAVVDGQPIHIEDLLAIAATRCLRSSRLALND